LLARVLKLRNVGIELGHGFGLERYVGKGRIIFEFGGLGLGGSERE
jgi:hypothetical protein